MMKFVGTIALLAFAVMLPGCSDDAQSGDATDTQRPKASNATGPAPQAGGTLTDDAGKTRMSIARVPLWEEYVSQHKQQHGGEEPPEPQTRRELYEEEKRLPTLYLTHQTLTRVIAPGDRRVHRDAGTGEMCSPAMGCYHPDCPKLADSGEPFGFLDTAASHLGRHCPACLETRDLAAETDADRAQWARWVRPHELPDTAARRREIMQERRRRIAWDRANR
ncbi:MAG: hypothetical protein MI757_18695 [Pirellulales bacterium]|nr:hypothetical protein [Pirellulales bacterium]